MSGSIRSDLQRRAGEIAQRQSNVNHDIRVLESMLDTAADARDRLDEEAQELVKVAELLGVWPFKPFNLYSFPADELTGEDWSTHPQKEAGDE